MLSPATADAIVYSIIIRDVEREVSLNIISRESITSKQTYNTGRHTLRLQEVLALVQSGLLEVPPPLIEIERGITAIHRTGVACAHQITM